MFSKLSCSLYGNSVSLLIMTLILGSLIICVRNPGSDSKFLDLAQAGLGGYLAILVQSKKQSI